MYKKILYGKVRIASHITSNMKKSLLKYFFIFILSISASIIAQDYSVNFDGQNGNINFNDVSIESGDGITFSFWINDDWGHSNYSNGDAIIDFGATSYCTPNSRYIIKKKNGEIQAWFEGGGFSGYGGGSNVSTNMLDHSNQFVHVAITFNGSEGHIYVNGVLKASSSYSYGGQFLLAEYSPNGVPCSNGQPADYKLMGGEGNYFLDGYIDDFSLWSYDMGTNEVNNVRAQGVSGNETDLVGYWNFNQGSGTTVFDQTSAGNNGTMSGDISWSTDVPPVLPVQGENNSLSFSGSNQYVEIGNPFSGNQSDFTISAWIKAIPSNDGYGRPFYVHNAAYADVVGNVQNNPGSETILFRIYEGDGSQDNTQIECDFSSHMGEWTYVTLMNESNGGGNNTQKILINGEVQASTNWDGEKNWSVGFVHEGIGGPYYDDPYTFKGNISSVEIWNN